MPKLGAAIAAGAGPDGAALDLIYMPTFASTGSLEDITSFIKAQPYFAALSPSHIRLATYKGEIYGVPLLPDASIIAYNKDLFVKAGLDPNKTADLPSGNCRRRQEDHRAWQWYLWFLFRRQFRKLAGL